MAVAPETRPLFAGKRAVRAHALLLGERIDLHTLEIAERLSVLPLTVAAGEAGCAVLFRYGAVVLFGLSPLEEVAFHQQLKPLLSEPFEQPETESVELRLHPDGTELVDNSVLRLRDFSLERLQIVADILAKSVVLEHYETSIAAVFDSLEPLAAGLHRQGRSRHQSKELLRHIGGALLIQHKMVGLVEVTEKPETLWERPDLERLYLRLEDEYEVRERHNALERKLDFISRSAETVLELLQHNSSLRVEWYIVVLIVLEILLTLYQMFFKG